MYGKDEIFEPRQNATLNLYICRNTLEKVSYFCSVAFPSEDSVKYL